MAAFVTPDGSDPATYRGLPRLYEYINQDGEHTKHNCGQAAACTLLTYCRVFPAEPTPEEASVIMKQVEADHPSDVAYGWFGASRRRVERICRVHGIETVEIDGEEALRNALANLQPVVVMLRTSVNLGWMSAPGGHWMVAFGYDDQNIYLSNMYPVAMSWEEFRYGWDSFIPQFISMRNIGLTAVTQLVEGLAAESTATA